MVKISISTCWVFNSPLLSVINKKNVKVVIKKVVAVIFKISSV